MSPQFAEPPVFEEVGGFEYDDQGRLVIHYAD